MCKFVINHTWHSPEDDSINFVCEDGTHFKTNQQTFRPMLDSGEIVMDCRGDIYESCGGHPKTGHCPECGIGRFEKMLAEGSTGDQDGTSYGTLGTLDIVG